MNDDRDGTSFPINWVLVILLILLLMNATRPVQQALPTYDGNTWSSQVHTEDNDTNTNVCIGWCADQGQ